MRRLSREYSQLLLITVVALGLHNFNNNLRSCDGSPAGEDPSTTRERILHSPSEIAYESVEEVA